MRAKLQSPTPLNAAQKNDRKTDRRLGAALLCIRALPEAQLSPADIGFLVRAVLELGRPVEPLFIFISERPAMYFLFFFPL